MLPMERVMKNAPVEKTQWDTLVSYWYSEEAKVISTNKYYIDLMSY